MRHHHGDGKMTIMLVSVWTVFVSFDLQDTQLFASPRRSDAANEPAPSPKSFLSFNHFTHAKIDQINTRKSSHIKNIPKEEKKS